MDEYQYQRNNKQWNGCYRHYNKRIYPECFIFNEYACFLNSFAVLHTHSTHKQAVGIDTVGSAGQESAVVLALDGLQVACLRGEHHLDLIHLIGEDTVENGYPEPVANLQFIEVGEQLGAGQTSVTREDTVSRITAHRESSSGEMTDADLQDFLSDTVVNGELGVELVDVDIAHDTRACYIESLIIAFDEVGDIERGRGIAEPLVIVLSLGEKVLQLVIGNGAELVVIGRNDMGGVFFVDIGADGRVEQHGEANDEHSYDNNAEKMFFHWILPDAIPFSGDGRAAPCRRYAFYEVLFFLDAHSLFSNEKNSTACDKESTYCVENDRANATGGGEGYAFVVFYLNFEYLCSIVKFSITTCK